MSLSIPKNIGRIDQILRACISLGMIYYGFFDLSLIQDKFSASIVGVLGSLNMIVALVQFCPLYSAVGINTYCQSQAED